MGAKLSKKKKGYCLGAGKDGESTETTEVEQKETENQKESENQEGQKDAAEPNEEKVPIDQSQNNGVSEELKDKKSGAEVTTGESTKDESNHDQKPEVKPSTEQEKMEHEDQPQSKEQDEGKLAANEEVPKEVKSKSEDKPKTECELKETLVAAAHKPTQESEPVKEKECKQSSSSETKQMAPVLDEGKVKQVSEPVTKVEAEQTKKAPAPVGTEDHISEKAAEVPTQTKKSVVEPEKVPEKVEPSAPESVPVEPVVEIVVSEPDLKTAVAEPAFSESVKLPEVAKPQGDAISEKVDSARPNSGPPPEPVLSVLSEPVEPVQKEPALASEPESSPEPAVKPATPKAVPEIKLEPAVPEEPTELPEQNVEPQKDPEPMPCNAPEKIEHDSSSEPLPPKSSEVPAESGHAQEHPENQESLGCNDHDAVTIQEPVTGAVSEISEQHSAHVMQNGPSEISTEDDHVDARPISTELKVEDNGEQKEAVVENGGVDKLSTKRESQVVTEDLSDTSKNESDCTTAQDIKETHDASQHCNSEDKTENHVDEDLKNEQEPPAPEILEKHGVGNGLPIKEEIKVHLENKCDNDLHDLNGQSESHEIEVCNE